MCSYGCGTINNRLHLLLSPPPIMMTCWPPLTVAYHACSCFLYLIDWEFVCVRFVSCQLLRVCMCVCALVHHSVMTSGAAQVQHLNTIRVTKQYMLSSGDHEALQADERQSSELLFYKMLRHLDDRHDAQLCRHMWQSSLPIPSPNWKHWCKR